MPYKTFVDGEVLKAEDVNTHLMRQSIISVAGQAERDAIEEPHPGLTVYRRSGGMRETWNGTTWVPEYLIDTGWVTIKVAANYEAVKPLQVRRIGKVVYWRGVVKRIGYDFFVGQKHAIVAQNTVPVMFRPNSYVHTLAAVCNGAGSPAACCPNANGGMDLTAAIEDGNEYFINGLSYALD